MRLFIFYEADVAVPAAAAVPGDEASRCHVSPDPSAVVTHAIAHGGWTMVRGLMVTSATATLPGSMSDSMRDNSRWIRRDMTKSSFILRHSSSCRNSSPSRVESMVTHMEMLSSRTPGCLRLALRYKKKLRKQSHKTQKS